ncbi:hypothetical protein HYFRA_00013957 [Hymenoscyphus fraxineus]|uniref:Zn(2)-C6 fungal-type domain-containing protein n=1 Tax=Hymenoscyphus fraxineus TaxID=746836 RepID=A0A9N9L9H0_9HELO|nr:hypothetical protein HYFRA_00013957 [Hymenoscyphus fraxineus]
MTSDGLGNQMGQQRITRRKGACGNCKKRKTRCNGEVECIQCKKSNLSCHYTETTQAKEKRGEINQLHVPEHGSYNYNLSEPLQSSIQNSFDMGAEGQHNTHNLPSPSSYLEQHTADTLPIPVPDSVIANQKLSMLVFQNCNSLSPLSCLPGHMDKYIKNQDLRKNGAQISTRLVSKIKNSLSEPSSDIKLPLIGKDHTFLYSPRITRLFIDAFFDETYYFRPYLQRADFDRSFADFTISPTLVEPSFLALANAILALGNDLYVKRNSVVSNSESALARNMTQYFHTALYYRPYLSNGLHSRVKLQALLTMLLFCHSRNEVDLTKLLLSEALESIRSLRLSQEGWTSDNSKNEDFENTNLMHQLIYIIEKPFLLRHGLPSTIDEEVLDSPLLKRYNMEESHLMNPKIDWMTVHIKYAILCRSVSKTLYGGYRDRNLSESLTHIKRLHHAVLNWESLIPSEYRPIQNPIEEFSDQVLKKHSSISWDITLKFCEVMLAIHRWAIFEVVMPAELEAHYSRNIASSRTICLSISKQILGLAQLASPNDQKSEWALLHLPAVAFGIVFLDTTACWSSKHELAYLGIACGIYARLTISCPNGSFNIFDEINQLSIIANRNVSNVPAGTEIVLPVSEKVDEMWFLNNQAAFPDIYEESGLHGSSEGIIFTCKEVENNENENENDLIVRSARSEYSEAHALKKVRASTRTLSGPANRHSSPITACQSEGKKLNQSNMLPPCLTERTGETERFIADYDIVTVLSFAQVVKFHMRLTKYLGVIWSGNKAIIGVAKTIQSLENSGKRMIFVTNNSTESRSHQLAQLQNFGISCSIEQIFTSGYCTAIYLSQILNQRSQPKKRVFVIGNPGIVSELSEAGLSVIDSSTDAYFSEEVVLGHFEKIATGTPLHSDVGAVVVGMDLKFNYLKLCHAMHYIRNGALFIATNTDSTFPIFDTVFPAAGFISAALSHTLDAEPRVMGKPSQLMMEVVKKQYDLDLQRTCMVGDRLDTDIRFGVEGGLGGTLLVLTGVCGEDDLKKAEKNAGEGTLLPTAFARSFSVLDTEYEVSGLE